MLPLYSWTNTSSYLTENFASYFVFPSFVITYGSTVFGLEVAGDSAYLIHIHNKRNIQRFQLYYAVLAERRDRIGVRASLGVIAEREREIVCLNSEASAPKVSADKLFLCFP